MGEHAEERPKSQSVASIVRKRIRRDGARLWRIADFDDLPFQPVAQTLSRLARTGEINRLSKGVYYRKRKTSLGPSRPNPAALRELTPKKKHLFPAGLTAANLLGFTTQTARRGELATNASSVPRKLIGQETIVHTRRPEAWARISEHEAALLDVLRCGGKTSELPPETTIERTLKLLVEKGRYERLLRVADTEPPRVRAMLGALGEQLHQPEHRLRRLKRSLNPASRFEFGVFARLPNAMAWQAKGSR